MSRPKVFVLGFHKTGTCSMAKALSLLGYRVVGPSLELVPSVEAQDLDAMYRVVDGYDAFQDDPWFLPYRQFDQRYPGSRFILTWRDSQVWIKSVQKHFGKRVSPSRRLVYGDVSPLSDPQHYVDVYERHVKGVREYFVDREEDFLEFRVGQDSWDSLCPFLGYSQPKTILGRSLPFPHANPASARDPRHWLRARVRRGVKEVVRRRLGPVAVERVTKVKDLFLYRLKL